jgi:two-component system C4-dicarboxylate transport response regulator DctD
MTEAVFLIEDDDAIRESVAQTFELASLSCRTFSCARSALEAIHQTGLPDVVVTDVKLKGIDGLQLLRSARSIDLGLPVIVITGQGDVPMAVEAMRSGAFDFLLKPFSSASIVARVRSAIASRPRGGAAGATPATANDSGMVGSSSAMQRVRAAVKALGASPADVLLLGETGTGKEVVARALHAASGRRGPFVAINCCALPEAMFESEMFGHEAGAFTGALRKRVGKLEHANGGTVFLDEVESMPLALQGKLLRAIQEREVERLGGNASVRIDCRFVTATKVDLLDAGTRGTFRTDLYYRIGVATLRLPPLRERIEDIPELYAYFAAEASSRFGLPLSPCPEPLLRDWATREWPGNVREFRNAVERHCFGVEVLIGDGDVGLPSSLNDLVADAERRYIESALRQSGGHVQQAAVRLGVPRKTLYDKLVRFAIDARQYRTGPDA